MLLSQRIIKDLDDQVVFLFTGRLSVVKRDVQDLVAVIKLIDGEIISSKYKKNSGIKALESFVVDYSTFDEDYFYVKVEPEDIGKNERNIFLDYQEILERLNSILDKSIQLKKMRPSDHIYFGLNQGLFNLVERIIVKPNDFEVMKELVSVVPVYELYERVKLPECEITESLIKLKSSGILQVLGNIRD